MTLRTSQGRVMFLILVAGVAMLLSSLTNAALWAVDKDTTPYAPLHDYPEQQVLNVNRDQITIEGTRCSTAEEVLIETTVTWIRTHPPGAVYQAGTSVYTLRFDAESGCRTTIFTNTVPSIVRELDLPGAEWRIVGADTPLKDGERGTVVGWESAAFMFPISQ